MAMHTGLKCAALLLLIAPLGCRSQGELDLAERDMRLQENRIYKLQEYVQQYQQMLEDCQAENESLRKQIAGGGKTPVPAASPKPRTLRELMNSNANKPPTDAVAPGPDLVLPVTPSIDLGTEFDPVLTAPVEKPALDKTDLNQRVLDKPVIEDTPAENSVPNPPGFLPTGPPAGPGELPEPDELPDPAAGGSNQPATQLEIRSIGQIPATPTMPAGLRVVIEPRSDQGGAARAPEGAKMSLMIVSSENDETLSRWDYSAEQTASAYSAGSGADTGWRFLVPFNKTPATPAKLKIYTRLVLPDGTKLISEREFNSAAGASIEELPSGDAGWFRSKQPIASLANKLGRNARTAFGGPQPRARSTRSGGTAPPASAAGGSAPAWQPQPAGPPTVSTGIPTSPSGGTAPAFSANAAPGWNLGEIPTAPTESKVGPVPVPAPPGPAAETATRPDRPGWSPYR